MYTRIQVGLIALVFAVVGGLGVGAAMTPRGVRQPAASIVFRIELNTAGQAELELLPGIGPKRATAIIASREADGPFRSVDDLIRIRGIGPATVAGLRRYAVASSRP